MKRAGINQLIRNLINTEYNEEQLEIIKNRLVDVLINLEKGDYSILKKLNVYSLFSLVLSPKFEDKKYRSIIELLEKILYYWINYSKYVSITNEGEKLVVIQDLSGSMSWREDLLRSAILLTLLLIKNSSLEIVVFDVNYDIETEYFKDYLKYKGTPLKMTYEIFKGLEKLGRKKYFRGTALREAVKGVIDEFDEIDKMVIISDEVSWAEDVWNEKNLLVYFPKEIRKVPKVIFYNPERNDNDVQVVENVIRIAGLSTQVFGILYDLKNLKKEILERYNSLKQLSKEERENRINKKRKIVVN